MTTEAKSAIEMTTCATLLATYFAGVQIADIDRKRVYEIPAAIVSSMSLAQRATAKACAFRYGIKYRIREDAPLEPAS